MSRETPPCLFEWNDRVDHCIFGLGIVIEEPTAGFGVTEIGHGIELKGRRCRRGAG